VGRNLHNLRAAELKDFTWHSWRCQWLWIFFAFCASTLLLEHQKAHPDCNNTRLQYISNLQRSVQEMFGELVLTCVEQVKSGPTTEKHSSSRSCSSSFQATPQQTENFFANAKMLTVISAAVTPSRARYNKWSQLTTELSRNNTSVTTTTMTSHTHTNNG